MSQDELYRQQVIELWRNPTNYGSIKGADSTAREINPLCGDEVQFFLKLQKPLPKKKESAVIEKAAFTGNGCAISKASCSLVAQEVQGMTVGQVLKLSPSRVNQILGVPLSPAREKCAYLSLRAVKAAAQKISSKKRDE